VAAGDEGTRRSGETQGRQLAGALRRAMAADRRYPYVERLADGAAPAFAEGDTLAGRYRVLAFLARGGMGEVYHVHDERLARTWR
jgi:hypothetical protein